MTVSKSSQAMRAQDVGADDLFQEIYATHFDYVWRLLRRFGSRERDREDLAHDVFVAVHRSLPRYDRARPIKPWLCGVTFRVVSDYRQKASFARELPVEEHLTACSPPEAFEHLEAQERRALVDAALERLPDDQRAVLVMHEMEEMSVPEIARALGIKDNTCYSRLRLARERFTKAVRAIAIKTGQSPR